MNEKTELSYERIKELAEQQGSWGACYGYSKESDYEKPVIPAHAYTFALAIEEELRAASPSSKSTKEAERLHAAIMNLPDGVLPAGEGDEFCRGFKFGHRAARHAAAELALASSSIKEEGAAFWCHKASHGEPRCTQECATCRAESAADGVMEALRYRVKGAPDGKWHYVDHPELMRRVIVTREEGEGGGYLYEVEPLAVIPAGVQATLPADDKWVMKAEWLAENLAQQAFNHADTAPARAALMAHLATHGVKACDGCRAEAEFWNDPGRKCVACLAGVEGV